MTIRNHIRTSTEQRRRSSGHISGLSDPSSVKEASLRRRSLQVGSRQTSIDTGGGPRLSPAKQINGSGTPFSFSNLISRRSSLPARVFKSRPLDFQGKSFELSEGDEERQDLNFRRIKILVVVFALLFCLAMLYLFVKEYNIQLNPKDWGFQSEHNVDQT